MDRELELMRKIVAMTERPVLHFERVFMTESGTMILTWTDSTNNLALLRKRLHQVFPGELHLTSGTGDTNVMTPTSFPASLASMILC